MTFQDSRRTRFLQEMGIDPVWRLRERAVPEAGSAMMANEEANVVDHAAVSSDEGLSTATASVSPTVLTTQSWNEEAAPATESRIIEPVSMERSDREIVLHAAAPVAQPAIQNKSSAWEDDVPAWVTEDAPADESIPFDLEDSVTAESIPGKPSVAEIARMDWHALESAVSICTKCRLCETRTRTVFGTGDRHAKWLFVGEGPGYNEDLQGEPFVGPAGKLLDNMLAAMGLRRGENAYIANVVKCRPTGDNGKDRPPAADEAAACLPYLQRQIALIQPDVIVALGKSAALALLGAAPDTPVSRLRGQVHRYADVPLVVTYHPAYLLRSPEEKGKAWRDLCLAMATRADAAAAR
ncbi:DNA polymerase [Paucimonas lemoignei]|uniref:Type-4 uracil-DNA glycosylase n=1 Tax=Paucimonas lemoignei TaxID=29443 RepID=A0A4V2UJA3_PAULE|nr:uracil-DNA glycosylase [Paucimonas lemoignei]TCS39220.1 DNA polymerase [Paucimonas lemoignei]